MPVRRLLFFITLLGCWGWPVQAAVDSVAAFRFLNHFQSVKVLTPPRDFTEIRIAGIDGRSDLMDQRGKWLIMNIWATWCPPCIEEMPQLDRLKMMRGSGQFDTLAVSIDLNKSAERISYFLKRWNIKYLKALYDDTRFISQELDVNALPTSYVINPEGKALAVLYGPAPWASEEALAFIDTLQADPTVLDRYEKQDKSFIKP